jgi:hypothetical protein
MRLEIDNRRRKISIKFYTLGFGILYASFWKIVTFRFTDYTEEKIYLAVEFARLA